MDHSLRGIRPARPVRTAGTSWGRRLDAKLAPAAPRRAARGRERPTAGRCGTGFQGRTPAARANGPAGTFESYLITTAGSDEEMRVLSWLRDYVRTALQLAEGFPDIEPAVERAHNEITAEYGRVIAAAYIKGHGAAELMNVISSAYDDFSDVESSLSPRVAASASSRSAPPGHRRRTGGSRARYSARAGPNSPTLPRLTSATVGCSVR